MGNSCKLYTATSGPCRMGNFPPEATSKMTFFRPIYFLLLAFVPMSVRPLFGVTQHSAPQLLFIPTKLDLLRNRVSHQSNQQFICALSFTGVGGGQYCSH